MDVNKELEQLKVEQNTMIQNHRKRMEEAHKFLEECEEAARECEATTKAQEENEAALNELLKGF